MKLKYLICLLLLHTPAGYAAWVGSSEVLSGSWGSGPTEFYVDWGDVPAFAVYPDISDIASDGLIAISDNGHFKIYSSTGQWVRNISPPYDSNMWGVAPLFIANNIVLSTSDFYFLSREGASVNQISGLGKLIFKGELNGNLYVASVKPAKRWLVYAPDGALLNTYTEKPPELGRITQDIFAFQGKKMHRLTIAYPDQSWSIVSPSSSICAEYDFIRDTSGNLYCAGNKNIVRYSACGKEVSSFKIPDDKVTTLLASQVGSGVEDIVQVDEGYGSIDMADNGDVYTSKVTPTEFSVIKWVWQASPGDMIGGPDAPTDFVATPQSNEVKLTWQSSLQDPGCVTGYEVSRATIAGGSYTVLSTTRLEVNEYIDTAVLTGNTYFYKVRAVSAVASSAYTNEVSAVVP